MNRVPLRVVGLKREMPPAAPPVPGQDFPQGIEYLDVSWFADEIGLDTLAAASDEKLVELHVRAAFVQRLFALKAMATRGK